jgi:hypothetical protein
MKSLTLLFILITSVAFGQITLTVNHLDSVGIREIFPTDTTTGKIMYREVMNVPNKTKQQIFDKGHEWLVRTFDSSKSVIQYSDASAGKMVGHGVVESRYTLLQTQKTDHVGFTIIIECRDGKIRCTVNQLGYIDDHGQIIEYFDSPAFLKSHAHSEKTTIESLTNANTQIIDLIKSLNGAVFTTKSDR